MPNTAEHWESEYRELVAEQSRAQSAAQAVRQLLERSTQQLLITCMGRSAHWDDRVETIRVQLQAAEDARDYERVLEDCEQLTRGLITDPLADPAAVRRIVESLKALRDDTWETMSVYGALVGLVDASQFMPADQLNPEHIRQDVSMLSEALLQGFKDLSLRHADAERFVDEVREALAQVAAIAQRDADAFDAQRDASDHLQQDVNAEVQTLREAVDDSTDLNALRQQVRMRFDTIMQRLTRFRDDENQRLDEVVGRNRTLRKEVADLRDKTSQLQEQLAEQRSLLLLDSLTGVNSRFSYDQRIEEEVARCQRGEHALSFTLWDIDHFKTVNDTYGHQAGDGVLKDIALALVRLTRTSDFVARLGGEEFVVLLPDTPAPAALDTANKVREAIAALSLVEHGLDRMVSVSVGVTQWQADDTVQTLYERADKALYAAKHNGRNRCERA
ncbi:MAG: diguanylate cyclase [Pseudomonadota bacterium]